MSSLSCFFKPPPSDSPPPYQPPSLFKPFDGYSSSAKSLPKDDQAQKLRRRSKKDKIGRNHVCGCGKKYLSYPALYTHIKTKHNGLAPEGTKALTNSKTKRGRPKKHDFREENSYSMVESSNMANITVNQKNEFIDFKSEELKKEELMVLGTVDVSCEGRCNPKDFFYSKGKRNHPFLNVFERIENGENSFSKLTCDIIFSLFLFQLSKIVSLKFFKIFVVFFNHLRECLNQHGYQIIQHQKNINEMINYHVLVKNGNKNLNLFCEVEGPENVPLVSNFFILDYMPKYCRLFDQSLAIGIFLDFVKWMNKNNHCKKKIIFDNVKFDEEI